MHEVLVNRLGGVSLPRKSVVRLTDRPDMTLDVYRGRKTTMQQQQQLCKLTHSCCAKCLGKCGSDRDVCCLLRPAHHLFIQFFEVYTCSHTEEINYRNVHTEKGQHKKTPSKTSPATARWTAISPTGTCSHQLVYIFTHLHVCLGEQVFRGMLCRTCFVPSH